MEITETQLTGQQAKIDVERAEPKAEEKGQTFSGADRAAVWDDAFLVTFSPADAENPLNWSTRLKWGVTIAVSGTGFVRIMVSTVRLLQHMASWALDLL